MLSCKCLNFIASTANQSQGTTPAFSLTDAFRQAFLQKYPRSFIFYSQCMDFFKQAIGPISDLTINSISQKDLIYSLTLEITVSGQQLQSWQLSICSNCNVVLCAKLVGDSANSQQQTPASYLINCGILTNNEELSQKRADKSYSETFGILIMDNLKVETSSNSQNQSNALVIGSLSASFATGSSMTTHLDSKQLRLRQLQSNLQQRLQREIAETDERIQRYTEQQFALLKSFREKSEQEYQMLVSLIQSIPEQQANEWLDRQPPNLDVSSNGGSLPYGASRRRNTISNRRDLNTTAPTTPTTTQPPSNIFLESKEKTNSEAVPNFSSTSAITTNNSRAAEDVVKNITVSSPSSSVNTTAVTSAVVGSVSSSISNRKMSNFDTPPATPEAPMSVGNSPTFRQQQQQQNISFVGQQSFQQQYPTPTVETADDCLFELEGVDAAATANTNTSYTNSPIYLQNPPSPMRQQHNQNVSHQILPVFSSFMNNRTMYQQSDSHQMSDLDESDGAEEAEDALDLDSSMPIAMATPQRRANASNIANFAKSLPIEIANSPLANGRSYIALDSDEDELDNNVDIAASIKALAKSVHGEAVFGDLPRPRLRSQI
ncbi:proline-rich Akt substrate 40 kDa [Haematobia irritans]|uniref:proline-rich Akt substrate 40 kDa n=1 Tax=Haematobia irritans TaxID=7368 RepID=UPI003F4FC4CD